MLILARKLGESIIIGDNIEVSVVEIKGNQVKLGVKAPKDVRINRFEIFQKIEEENRLAADSAVTVDVLNNIVIKKKAEK